ncbi:Uncharacterized protein TCM_022499 [Theobroma cacao]|uniref:Uncharacterized protein n=1 Tax=Theobroma cacao TaxID=3641 RepID=A0A061F109_THECC|nr:Uncharacterized protein TCM_022499 [Theobroma cacao]
MYKTNVKCLKYIFFSFSLFSFLSSQLTMLFYVDPLMVESGSLVARSSSVEERRRAQGNTKSDIPMVRFGQGTSSRYLLCCLPSLFVIICRLRIEKNLVREGERMLGRERKKLYLI